MGAVVRLLKDHLLTRRPTEYVLLLGQQGAHFLSVRSSGRIELLLTQQGDSSDMARVDSFLSRLVTSSAYYGQPFRIILGNSSSFAYVKRLGKESPGQLLERLTLLRDEALVSSFTTREMDGSTLFVYQAVRKDYLHDLQGMIERHGCRVTEIVPIAGQLLAGGALPRAGTRSAALFVFPGDEKYLGAFTEGSDIVFDAVPDQCLGSTETETLVNIMRAYVPGAAVRGTVYAYPGQHGSRKTNDTRPLGKLLYTRMNPGSALKALTFEVPRRKTAGLVRTALNASHLLTQVLGGMMLLTLGAAGVCSFLAGDGSQQLEEFQQAYTTRQNLIRQQDSLQAVGQSLSERADGTRPVAALLSAFCQSKPYRLHLTQISVDQSDSVAVQVEVSGNSVTESAIFRYHESLGQYLSPHEVTVSSVRPQRAGGRSEADSSFVFRLSVVLEGAADAR